MALRDEQRVTIRSDVLSRVLDGEAVLLDLKSGTYFGLNEVGTELWQQLAAGATVAELRQHLLDRYEIDRDTVDADVEALVAELVRRELADVSG
jgi:hypothetical protein